MNAFTQLTLIATTVALCAATTQVMAADIVASPKVLELQKSLAKVGSSNGDQIDRTVHTVPPRTLAHQRSLAKIGSPEGDKLDRTISTVPPRTRQAFELAPLK